MSVELGLAIAATVDLCLKYGQTLIHMCVAFKNAQTRIAHRILRVKASWIRASHHLDLLGRVAPILPLEYQQLQSQTLDVLCDKLKTTVSTLESMIKKNESSTHAEERTQQTVTVRRWKYAALEERLDSAIDDLETWQGIFDPSWYLIMKSAMPQIDQELASLGGRQDQTPISSAHALRHELKDSSHSATPIWLRKDGIADASLSDIPFSSAKTAQKPEWSRMVILESTTCQAQADVSILIKDVRDLARKLSLAEPATFGLLQCKGVVKHVDDQHPQGLTSFTFVFKVPDGFSEPKSLRSMLLSGHGDHSLSNRFGIAAELARAVCSIHTFGFVHKSVCPENILMLGANGGSLGHAYLVGFEHFRAAHGRTTRLGDSNWESNLYRHPRRQGQIPEEEYVMQHDIYSLGVCLLELGMWQSFVEYEEQDSGPPIPGPSRALDLPSDNFAFDNPSLLKDRLLLLARRVLSRRMGSKYAEIVVTCLTCLDPDNADFGDESEFQDEDGILVGVRYIERVLMRLSVISV